MTIRTLLLAAGAAFVATAGPAAALIISDFESGRDGWTLVGDPTSGTPALNAAGGSTGAYISGVDQGLGQYSMFEAGSKFHGDLSAYLGGTLSWEILIGGPGSFTLLTDVILSNGATSLFAQVVNAPFAADAWQSLSVSLDPGAWAVGSAGGATATEGDMLGVLGALSSLRIRGEYLDAAGDTFGLDSVVLAGVSEVPLPAGAALLPAALALLGLRSRRKA